MTDLLITEKKGWVELEDVDDAVESDELDVEALWLAIAADDLRAQKKIIAAAFIIKRGEPIEEVFAMKEPGEEGEDRVRIWIK